MTVLRRLAMPAALLLATVAVPGCGSVPGPVPGVAGGFGTDPVITIPNGKPSPDMIVKTVIPGHGPVIQPGDYVLFNVQGKVWAGDREVVDSYTGQTVVVQYTGVVWRTGKTFDSSWARGFPESFLLGAGQVIPGWERGLAGVPAGSRVLLVLPPALGYGQAGDPPDVDGHDTLIFVVDILAAL